MSKELVITIHASLDGFPIDLCYTGTIDALPGTLARLRELGGAPVASHTAPLNGEKKPAKRVQPAYDGDGQPICPVHRKPLSEGRYGLFCPAKAKDGEQQNDKGYCSLKFVDE